MCIRDRNKEMARVPEQKLRQTVDSILRENKNKLGTLTLRIVREKTEEKLKLALGALTDQKDEIKDLISELLPKYEEDGQQEEEEEKDEPIPVAPGKRKAAPETKVSAKKAKAEDDGLEENEKGEFVLTLGSSEYLRARISKFKNMTLIDIRKWYKDKASGEIKPGNKGISLTEQQWESLKENMNRIDTAISKI
eukprot:TRINITY_DN509_c0_g1_i2.p1 TRINITY_DN509_c0_g1~~TRINITY_DN509_c0_g1_i2.p1  ORF type:complete len:194 (-),score=53.68 TRINITY_DN509_c0_g1_i2:39-620(-)